MTWILYALAGAFFAALNRTLMKGVAPHVTDQMIVLWRNVFAAAPAVLLLFITETPPLGNPFFYSIPIACVIDVCAIMLMSRSLRSSSMGGSVPMLSFTPVFLLLTGWLILGEKPNLLGLTGIIIVVAGSYYLGSRGTRRHLLEPFYMILRDPGPRYMLGAAACFAVAGPYFKLALLNSSPYFTLAFSLPLASLLTLFYHLLGGGSLISVFPRRGTFMLLALGLSVFGVALTTNLAFETGLTSYVVSIKRISIVFNIIIGAYFFQETEVRKHLAAAAVMIAGAVIIAVS